MQVSSRSVKMSSADEETEQETSLNLYKTQLLQVEQAIQLGGESADLSQLRNDLKELITLTEENLLQLKKARLLKSLESSTEDLSQTEDSTAQVNTDEYAAFQASISELSSPQSNNQHSSPSSPLLKSSSQVIHTVSKTVQQDSFKPDEDTGSSSDDDDDIDDDDNDFNTSLSHLIGTKCQAPIRNDWGGHHYGNAMIWSLDTPSDFSQSSNYMVRVIFLNPTQPSMVPCSYYLNGSCRFSDENCRRSHGQAVLVSDLRPYQEPDHSQICEGCRCLAKSTDDVWYPATVVDVCDDHQVNVKFDAGNREMTVLVENIMPLSEEDKDSSDDSEEEAERSVSSLDTPDKNLHKSGKKNDDDDDEDSDDGLPVYLWRPSQTTERLGAWEAHTKGIGSRLMAKMGYVHGQGLGRTGEGRAEPVPIMLLPQGKSLDKIMELKDAAGNADLFNAMKKMERRQKAMEKKEAEKEKRRQERTSLGVFGFLNKKLQPHTGNPKDSRHASHAHTSKHGKGKATPTAAKELEKWSDKDVNVQIFKTSEEMLNVERRLKQLRHQLARNETRDRKMADQVRQKIEEHENYLHQLKTSSHTLESHKKSRSAHKKLTIF